MATSIDVLEKDPKFRTLLAALRSSGLIKILKTTKAYTFFAPTNEAFQKIPAEELELLFQNKEKMSNVLNNHLIPEYLLLNDIKEKKKIKNFNCIELEVSSDLKINNAAIIESNIETENAVIHVIDRIMMP
jgi:uncharacterized surface protein with fasciclin (FAS1) repeats